MADENRSSYPLLGTDWHQFENVVASFEEAWQKGSRPALADFLPTESGPRLT